MPGTRYTARARSRPPRIGLIVAMALVAVALALGAVAGRSSAPSGHDVAAAPSSGGETTHKPARPASLRSRAGAVTVATSFLAALRWHVLIDERRRVAAVDRFAAADGERALQATVAHGVGAVRRAVRVGPVIARPVPVGYRVDDFTPARATVSIWGMALFGSGAYEPVSQWATSTVELVWSDDTWKVAALRSRGGPSPRWSIEELARDAASFEEYRHAP